MARVHNFNAGPAGLPLPALLKAQEELVEFEGTGMSIMEHSHRGAAYEKVHNEAKSLLVDLLDIPADYDVLFLQGGASLQFAMLPMNFLPADKSADYVITGGWSEKAYEEAGRIGKARIAATTAVDKKYTRVPKQAELDLAKDAAYAHITTNNTLFGTQWHYTPEVTAPLIGDMSSDFLWKKIDVSKYSLIYAGAQKNIGPSGVVVVIVKKSYLATARTDAPVILRYETHAKNNSLYNTPPTFGIYLIRNVLRFVKDEGGLEAMEAKNREKGAILYGALDEMSTYYAAPVEAESRSFMNVVFRLPSEALEKKFVADAAADGMVGLAGHRSTGGIRASTYNAVSVDSVAFLVDFMRRFRRANP